MVKVVTPPKTLPRPYVGERPQTETVNRSRSVGVDAKKERTMLSTDMIACTGWVIRAAIARPCAESSSTFRLPNHFECHISRAPRCSSESGHHWANSEMLRSAYETGSLQRIFNP